MANSRSTTADPMPSFPATATIMPSSCWDLADTYTQGSGQREDIRSTAAYPFVQDSWKIKPNLTLNYGLRWEYNPPLTDISGHVETFRPGQNSTVYPCGITTSAVPTGRVSLGRVESQLAPTLVPNPLAWWCPAIRRSRRNDLNLLQVFRPAHRRGVQPQLQQWALAVFGSNGKTSIRAGWGLFYNPIEELVAGAVRCRASFRRKFLAFRRFFQYSLREPGRVLQLPILSAESSRPTKGQPTDLSLFRPILLYGEFEPHLRSQYTSQYNLTIQRELSNSTMFQIGYVGSAGTSIAGFARHQSLQLRRPVWIS